MSVSLSLYRKVAVVIFAEPGLQFGDLHEAVSSGTASFGFHDERGEAMQMRMTLHAVPGRPIVEVYDNTGRIAASIYRGDATNGIRIVSRHIEDAILDDSRRDVPPVPAVTVKFKAVGNENAMETDRPWPFLRGRRAWCSKPPSLSKWKSATATPPKPKRMRVGVDMTKADIGGLAMLLIAKGLFTADEYAEPQRLAANTELAMRKAEHCGIRFR